MSADLAYKLWCFLAGKGAKVPQHRTQFNEGEPVTAEPSDLKEFFKDDLLPGPTGTEKDVADDIAARQALGLEKYGTSVRDNPLTKKQWLQHAYEEALDLPVYLKRTIEEEDNLQHRIQELEAWKKSAMSVLGEWERVWIAAGKPGVLGSSKAESVRRKLEGPPDCSAGLDCPNCDNVGGYGVPYMDTSGVMQAEERQCQWCHETPNSKFNLQQNDCRDSSPSGD